MVHRLLALAIFLGIVSSCLFGSTALAQDDELAERRKAAQALADNAFDLMQKGLPAEAAELFRKADERFHSPVFVLFEAEAWEKQGNLLKARALLAGIAKEKLAEYAPDAFRKAQDKARTKLAELDKRIPTLLVELPGASATDVTVTIGDETLSGSALEKPVRLEPGSYVVRATGTAGQADETSVTLAEGDRKTIALNVAPEVVDAPEPTTPDEGGGIPSWLGPAIAYGVGGAGLIMGVVAGGIFVGKADDLKAKCEAYPTPAADPNLCPRDTDEEGDEVKLLGNVATAGFVIAGVGAVAGTLLLLFMPDDDAQAGVPEVWLGPTGFSVRGRF